MGNLDNCSLCDKESFSFYITFCRTCNIPMLVSTVHKSNFSDEEKQLIKRMFPDRNVRYEMRSIKFHAHCHLLP